MKKEIDIQDSGRNIKATLVGPSLWGWIYRSKEANHFFRLLPYKDIQKFSLRLEIEECINKPCRRGFAPIVETGEVSINDDSYYTIKYTTSGISLAEILSGKDNKDLIFCISKVFLALQDWWDFETHAGTLMPADIVFYEQWPLLLSLPVINFWPRFETLTAEPARVLFLPPEIIRGNRYMVREKNCAIYSCGALLAQSLFNINASVSPSNLLKQAATSSLFTKGKHPTRLPYWLEKTGSLKNVMKIMETSLDPDPRVRSALNLAHASEIIETLAGFLDPIVVAKDLRAKKKFKEAVDFINDVSISEDNYDLFMLAIKITIEDLDHPLDAIELFERAIARAPTGEKSVYRYQLDVLMKIVGNFSEITVLESFLEKLDLLVWRDYSVLSFKEQTAYMLHCAEYFIKRKKFRYAQNVLHRHLYDAEGKSFLWWEFPSTILFAEAMLGEAAMDPTKLDSTRKFLNGVKSAVSKITNLPLDHPNRRNFNINALRNHGERITKLDLKFLKISKQ